MTTNDLPNRIVTTEYLNSAWTLTDLAALSGKPIEFVLARLVSTEHRVQQVLRNKNCRIGVEDERVRPEGFAGLLKLDSRLEVEISPKFVSQSVATWREDFFYISTLSRFGRVLPREALQAVRGAKGDLATLVGRAIVQVVSENQRRPLRTYRRTASTEYAADGDLDPEDLLFPGDDGFRVSNYQLSRQNDFNATIREALDILLGEVRDGETQRQLERASHWLGAQGRGTSIGRVRSVPGRSRGWQPAYDIACDVIRGFGIRYGERDARAPGFLVDTWRAWQDLIGIALRIGLPSSMPAAQRPFTLGDRVSGGVSRTVRVVPDFFVTAPHPVIVDAKYKGRAAVGRDAIAESDLYETLAFMEASASRTAVLMFPAIRTTGNETQPGSCVEFERITTRQGTIFGVEVDVCGISREQGLQTFAASVGAWLQTHALT